jgi:heat shock protein beta
VEDLLNRDLEVLYLVDPIDEVALSSLSRYKEKKFVDISKEDLDLGGEDKVKEEEVEKEYQGLCDWLSKSLGEKVSKVQVSKRRTSSPCVLVSAKFGWSANMEKIMKAQTFGDESKAFHSLLRRRTLEINPHHQIIKDLNSMFNDDTSSIEAEKLAELLFETANLSSGFTPENPAGFGGRVFEMMGLALEAKRKTAAAPVSSGSDDNSSASEQKVTAEVSA